jgi:hypothetical protein
MNFYWIKSPLPALAGFLLLWFIRRQDRLDPSSPHFQGSQALDDLGEYLDRELEKKIERSKHTPQITPTRIASAISTIFPTPFSLIRDWKHWTAQS